MANDTRNFKYLNISWEMKKRYVEHFINADQFKVISIHHKLSMNNLKDQ